MSFLNQRTYLQGLAELPPWTLFPCFEVESGGHRCHFPILPSGSSSKVEENVVPSRGSHRQPFLGAGSEMEVPGDEWQAFASDIEGRRRYLFLNDYMSYEELLALEERIGDVKTGLSEEFILKSMKQRKHLKDHVAACFTLPESSMVVLTEPHVREKAEMEVFELCIALGLKKRLDVIEEDIRVYSDMGLSKLTRIIVLWNLGFKA
ncbi:hypothetical protein L2E82_01567 [Cichorium intybus]|uniref:Uncharacterized protein n=1 Tax=Cichorium intybus TaxID=13427 RepID=A0ACB9H0C2_CICIN|nr:hypothetical protein L2E82_01567 [Cichorium intybus]